MKQNIFIILILMFFSYSSIGLSADFQKGLAAFQKGDFATALIEWKTLAEQGNASAQYSLGVRYGNGDGVIHDNIYAHMWWNISASNGDKSASEYREIIAKEMTSADISAAQKLARDCVKKKYKRC